MGGDMTGRAQSGIQKRHAFGAVSPNGLLLRGVVVNTYVLDDPNHPTATETGTDPTVTEPVAVYCDVLVYSSKRALHAFCLSKVPVLQDRGGIHDGRIWKPRAARIDVTGNPADIQSATILGNLDGDHVLVGFYDDNMGAPIILGGLAHPSHDVGNLDRLKGHRRGLKLADGDPDFWKHHGTFFGVDDNGDYLVDTTHANDGQLNPDGTEPLPPTGTNGSQMASLPMTAERRAEWFEVAPDGGMVSTGYESIKNDAYELSLDDVKVFLKLVMANLELKLDGGATLKAELKDADAKLTIGDGAKSAVIAEAWETFFDTTFKTWITTHTHPTGVGPSGFPAESAGFPAYSDSAATSTKLKFPDA